MYMLKPALICILCFLIVSCSERTQQEVKRNIDTASQKLGRDVDTLINTKLSTDSLYDNAPETKIDTSSLSSQTFRKKMNSIFDQYTDIKDALSDDDSSDVTKQSDEFSKELMEIQTESASETPGRNWRLWISSTEKIIADIKSAKSLSDQRKFFQQLTSGMEKLLKEFGLSDKTIYRVSCSKTETGKSFWFTDSKDNANPYFGKDESNEKSQPCIENITRYEFK